jgi:hypothetical protein
MKKFLSDYKVWIAIAGLIGSALGFATGAAYQAGCVTTTVSQVSEATRELYTDVKVIKGDVSTLKVDSATTKQAVNDIKEYLIPKKPLAEKQQWEVRNVPHLQKPSCPEAEKP